MWGGEEEELGGRLNERRRNVLALVHRHRRGGDRRRPSAPFSSRARHDQLVGDPQLAGAAALVPAPAATIRAIRSDPRPRRRHFPPGPGLPVPVPGRPGRQAPQKATERAPVVSSLPSFLTLPFSFARRRRRRRRPRPRRRAQRHTGGHASHHDPAPPTTPPPRPRRRPDAAHHPTRPHHHHHHDDDHDRPSPDARTPPITLPLGLTLTAGRSTGRPSVVAVDDLTRLITPGPRPPWGESGDESSGADFPQPGRIESAQVPLRPRIPSPEDHSPSKPGKITGWVSVISRCESSSSSDSGPCGCSGPSIGSRAR